MEKIKEVIVVEGKTDTAIIKKLFDADTIETHGLAINDEILDLIEQANQSRGVIVLTDPDYPGMQIRNKIMERVPSIKHAFVDKKDAIGILTITPSEASIIAADVATKSSDVSLGFIDRFSGSVVISGDVSSVESALDEVLEVLGNMLNFSSTKITRT